MRFINKITTVVAAIALLTSCQRENEVIEPEMLPPGGTGGKITLNVTPQHREKNIGNFPVDTTIVYIKYGSDKMPASLSDFDNFDTVRVMGGRPMVTFENLTAGQYYLYAEGQNDSLAPKNINVIGGAPFTIVDTFRKNYDVFLQLYSLE